MKSKLNVQDFSGFSHACASGLVHSFTLAHTPTLNTMHDTLTHAVRERPFTTGGGGRENSVWDSKKLSPHMAHPRPA